MKKILTASAGFLLVFSVVLAFSGCQDSQHGSAQEPAKQETVQTDATDTAKTVIIRDFAFLPLNLEIKAGEKVSWRNKDATSHAVVVDGLFDSLAIQPGKSISYTFEKPGEYKYKCTIHPTMVGTITVK